MSRAVTGHLPIFIVIKLSFLPEVHRLGAWRISQATLWTSEIMAEECGIRCCGHVIHPDVWRKTIFTRGIKKTTEPQQKAVCETQNSLLAPFAPLWQGEAPYPKCKVGAGHCGSAGMRLGSSSERAVATSQRHSGTQGMPVVAHRALMLWSQEHQPCTLNLANGHARVPEWAKEQWNTPLAENVFPQELVTNAGEKLLAMIHCFAVLIIPLTLF